MRVTSVIYSVLNSNLPMASLPYAKQLTLKSLLVISFPVACLLRVNPIARRVAPSYHYTCWQLYLTLMKLTPWHTSGIKA